MSVSPSQRQVVKFGPFEVDLAAGEIRKAGMKQKLAPQPFRVLQVLLERPHEVVTREEFRERVWSDNTFVDYELALKKAINRLREVLGDSAETPRFIETVPRRGYRFIAWLDLPVVPPKPAPPEPEPTPLPPKLRWWKRKAAIAVAACAGVAGLLSLRVAPQIERLWRLNELQHLTIVPLTTLPGNVASPTFSPDGSQVAFGWDGESNGKGYDLYVKVVGSEKPLRLTYHPAVWLSTAWSPDGRSIAISRVAKEGDSGIYLIPPTGGPERKLAARSMETNYGNEISWSPDGQFLAFIDQRANATTQESLKLFLLSLNTLERTQIQTNCGQAATPSFSPHGTFLAWGCEGTEFRSSLMLLRLKDGRQTQLLRRPDEILGLAWSSDESRIVFSFQSGLWETSLARPDDPEILPIGHDASDLAAKPTGQGLAYVQGSSTVHLWRLDFASPPHARKLTASSGEQNSPDISPDGNKIAFESTQSGVREIWVADANGSNGKQITDFRNPATGTPRWSPDGKLIAFESGVGGEADLYIVNPNGGFPHKLRIDRRGNAMPNWSKDGAWIYFTDVDSAVWKVPSQGGHAVQIAASTASVAIESPNGQYVYFVREKKLWRSRPDGSTEQPVAGMPEINYLGGEWFPAEAGIYFLSHANGQTTIDLFDLRSRQTRPIFTLGKSTPQWIGGMPVSKDGKFMLYPQVDSASSDLLMIGNWR